MNVEDIRAKFPKELKELLVFEDYPEVVIVNRKAFLERTDFAAVSKIVEDLEGQYVRLNEETNGKFSHWKIPKKKVEPPKQPEDPYARMDQAIRSLVNAWRELNPE